MQCENEINTKILRWKTNRGRGKRDLTIAPPFSSPDSKPQTMKLTKYVFLFPSAVEKVSNRFNVPYFSASYMFVLYTIQYLPNDCTQKGILRHAKRMNYTISPTSVSLAVSQFLSVGFIDIVDARLSLAPLGREYLSAIRRYLLNQRL